MYWKATPDNLCKQGLIQCLVICSMIFFRIFVFVITNNLINMTNSRSSVQRLIRFLKLSFNRYSKSIVWLPVMELTAVGNEKITSRFKRNIKSNSNLVHYRPYEGAKKGKDVANIRQLMKSLTSTFSFDLFMDNYFTSFRLFICLLTLELTTLEQEVCSTKIGYSINRGQTVVPVDTTNTVSSGTNSC